MALIITASRGSSIVAVERGEVIYSAKSLRSFGNMIVIRHARGYYSLYAHNKVNYVRRGDFVEGGTDWRGGEHGAIQWEFISILK